MLGRRLAEETAAVADRCPHRLERVGRQFLRHEADEAPSGAVIPDDIVPGDGDGAGRGGDNSANDGDQRGLASTVRAEQSEDFALLDVEADAVERDEPRAVGFAQIRDANDWLHGLPHTPRGCCNSVLSQVMSRKRHAICRKTELALTAARLPQIPLRSRFARIIANRNDALPASSSRN